MFKYKIILLFCGLLLTSCISVPGGQPPDISEGIEKDAVNLNEAHNYATSAVILINILRARDRWPTNYTTLSGIKSSPEIDTEGKVSLTPLGLGNPRGPFQGSGGELSRNAKAPAEYTVTPMAGGPSSTGVLRQLPPQVFEYYWNSFWPHEVLLALLVGSIRTNGSVPILIRNHGDDLADQTNGGPRAFLLHVKDSMPWLFDSDVRFEPVSAGKPCPTLANGSLGDFAKMDSKQEDGATYVDQLGKLKDLSGGAMHISFDRKHRRVEVKACSDDEKEYAFFKPGDQKKQLPASQVDFRSFDDVVYYLGETIRNPVPTAAFRAMCGSNAAVGDWPPIPLFQVSARSRLNALFDRQRYAVVVDYAGETYGAAPRVELTGPDTCPKERTGTVLALLSQLFLLDQSADFLKAPQSILLRQ